MLEFQNTSATLEDILCRIKKLEMLFLKRSKPFIDINEASEYLGICKQTIYQYTSRGRIPYHKLFNRRLYFSVKDLDEFILSQSRHKSKQETENEAITKVALNT